jgi:CubicO group peptidase (beta-lactamase class C family)
VTQQFLASYADKLEARLKNRSVGYSFTVTGGNGNLMVSRAGGDARRAPDSARKMTADDKFNVASVSKTITAAAVMKLLNQKNITVDTAVRAYLPPNWKIGPAFETVTFRNLLTHNSGIRCEAEVTYANLKACVEKGINPPSKATQSYNNSNYALFRLIIPRLSGYPILPGIEESKLAAMYANQYADYVRKNVFAPIGLSGIDLKPAASSPALAYQFPSPVQAGESFGDMTETSASRGWNMSSKQLAIFLHNLLYTEKIVPRTVSQLMKSEQLGLWKAKATDARLLDYEHGGYYPGNRNGGEMNTLIANFPNGVNVAIIVNSQFGPGMSIADAARAAMKEVLN